VAGPHPVDAGHVTLKLVGVSAVIVIKAFSKLGAYVTVPAVDDVSVICTSVILPFFIYCTPNGTERFIDISSWFYSFFLFLLKPTTETKDSSLFYVFSEDYLRLRRDFLLRERRRLLRPPVLRQAGLTVLAS